MSRVPNTLHNRNPWDCISAMQKYIRRGMELEAMEVAVELGHSSKSFASWVCNRLEVISHEDVGLAAPEVIPLVRTCCAQARERWIEGDCGEWRMFVGTAIRALARAPKSREGDHFQAVAGIPNLLGEKVPEIPDWTLDKHTRAGKKMGRGLDHFRAVSAVLVPPPAEKDRYEDAAYAWFWRQADEKACGAAMRQVENGSPAG